MAKKAAKKKAKKKATKKKAIKRKAAEDGGKGVSRGASKVIKGMSEKEVLGEIVWAAKDRRTELNLSKWWIKSLPGEIGKLTDLTKLDLSFNKLTSLPVELKNLTNLTTLNLASNQLTSLPAELKNLTNLTTLNLASNQFTSLPAELSYLANLTTLHLGGNRLTRLPAELRDLMNLTTLNLGGNKLTRLPAELGKLTNLRELHVQGNPLEWPPMEVVKSGTEAVLSYLRERLEARDEKRGTKAAEEDMGEGGSLGKTFQELAAWFRPTTKRIIEQAWEYAEEVNTERVTLTTSLLLLGMAECGRRETIYNSAGFLYKKVGERMGEVLHSYWRRKRLEKRGAQVGKGVKTKGRAVTDYTLGVLRKAHEIAVSTTGKDALSSRHLLGGLILYRPKKPEAGAQKRLREMGIKVDEFTAEFLSFLRGADLEEEEMKAWDRILGEEGGEIEQQEEAEELGSYHAPIAAFSGDGIRDAEGRLVDQLGIEAEVNAMSSLVAVRDIKWPLSIGLFGDWGSGKTFFMEMMQERIERISGESREWVRAGNESDYCRNVVQIRFNAWHYMDANLWASLVTHIFEELVEQTSEDRKEDVEARRSEIFERLESAVQFREDAEAKERTARTLREGAEAKLKRLETERKQAEDKLNDISKRELFASAWEDESVQEELRRAAKDLGLDEVGLNRKELEEVADQARDIVGNIRLAWRRASKKEGKWKLIGITAFLAILPVLIWLITRLLLDVGIQDIIGTAGGVGMALFELMKVVRPRLAQVQKGVVRWDKIWQQVQDVKDKEAQQKTEEERSVLREIEDLREKEREAGEDKERADDLGREAERELEEIKTGRRLYRYIEERSQRAEYKEQLGIISMIRNDFEGLRKVLAESARDTSVGDRRRVDRIVLYIDDLDRCPSKRVVEVLQAVHLLLAFDLFVVVVGVDPRWILHALRDEFTAFRIGDGDSEELGRRWLTTPQNYVEKIFQIPFALRPMGDRGYRRLMGKLVEGEGKKDEKSMLDEEDVVIQEDSEEQDLEPVIQQHGEEVIHTKEPKDMVEEEKDTPKEFEPTIKMKPPFANLRNYEAEFMKTLGDLIPSPRAAKRFMNIYRLTLASMDDRKKLDDLRGTKNRQGDYQAVLLMLAILTGFPEQGADILRTLADGGGKCNGILDFVRKLKTRKELKSEPARYCNGVRKGILEAERAVWDRLSNILKDRIAKLGVRDSLEPFVRWAGWVARFSFQYKPVISEEEGGEEDVGLTRGLGD